MAKSTIDKKENIEEKLEYLGLDLENIPKQLKDFEPLKFRIPKTYEEKQYKQYRYVPVKEIEILLSPTTRLDDLEEKYKKASPLSEYLDNTSEDNILRYTTFLNMLKQFKIEDVEKVKEEQEKLNKKLPFKIKYEGNYLWQIYYSENTDKYFMLVPTQDSDYSTFFYLLKKQIENKREGKIFVPIRNLEYSHKYLSKTEFEDIENYMWLFTKDWPLVYEVYNKKNELSICIIGETEVYQKVKSNYKIELKNKEEAQEFYKLLKAMFILQTELPHYFTFKTNISKNGGIEFYRDEYEMEYEDIAKWLVEEYEIGENKLKDTEVKIEEGTEKLNNLKSEVAIQEIEYLAKEKQISTFLECKKTFFGKFKYYFKYSKKSNKNKMKPKKVEELKEEKEEKETKKVLKIKNSKNKKANYTIEDILELYKELQEKETELKNIVLDINALKLKKKNMAKKIENATAYIEEIDSHKKSIFEFWRYSNKDEVASLAEGEAEEVNVIKKIEKVFDYNQDLEKFGIKMDKMQRKILSKDELDSVYLTSTNLLEILNKVKLNEVLPKEIGASLKELKKEEAEDKTFTKSEEFNIFGGIAQDTTKVSKINNKEHRELPKDKFNILDLTKNTKQIGYKLSLETAIENIKKALDKVIIPEELPVYMATEETSLEPKKINVFNINPEKEIEEAVLNKETKINLFKLNLKENSNAISFTNSVFYDNQNKTLPIGQDLSTKILVDVNKLKLKVKNKSKFKIIEFENSQDDFSKVAIKTVQVTEYDIDIEDKK